MSNRWQPVSILKLWGPRHRNIKGVNCMRLLFWWHYAHSSKLARIFGDTLFWSLYHSRGLHSVFFAYIMVYVWPYYFFFQLYVDVSNSFPPLTVLFAQFWRLNSILMSLLNVLSVLQKRRVCCSKIFSMFSYFKLMH